MSWQYSPYVSPLLIAAAVSVALALCTWRRRHVSGAVPFAALMLAVAVWSLGYALELGSVDLSVKVLWAKVQYLGIVTVPPAWLIFAFQYTRQDGWLMRRTRSAALLAIVPLVTLLLVWTNEVCNLVWREIRLDTDGSFTMMIFTRGPWYWVNMAYSYVLLLIGTLLLVQGLVRSPYLYRGQFIALLIGTLAPWVGNALYISGVNPFPHLDLTPFAFTLTGLAASWGLFRYRLLDIVPVARDIVVENMDDGVIVLDAQNRIVDLNRAAGHIVGRSASEAIGQPVAQTLSALPDIVERCRDVTEMHTEIIVGKGERQRTCDIRISPLRDRHGHLISRLVVLRDITERKQAEEALRFTQFAIDRASEAAFWIGPDARFIYVNDAACRNLGYSREELLAMTVHDVDVDYPPEVWPDHWREVKERGSFTLESRHRAKDGRTFPVEITVNFVKFEGREYSCAFARDITERKQVEETLHQSLEEVARRQRLLLALSQAAQAVQRARTPEEVYLVVAGEIASLGYHAAIYTVTDDRTRLALSHITFEPELLRTAENLPDLSALDFNIPLVPGGFDLRAVAEEGTVFADPDAGSVTEALPEPVRQLVDHLAAVLGPAHVIYAPLTVSDETHGLLVVTGVGLTKADVPAVTTFANQVAIAVENTRLYQQAQQEIAQRRRTEEALRQRNRDLAMLNRTGQELTAMLDLQEVTKQLLQTVTDAVGARGASIWLWDGDQEDFLTCRAVIHSGQERPPANLRLSPGQGIAGWVAQTGESIIVANAHGDSRFFRGIDEQTGFRTLSVLAVPLRARGVVVGVLEVVNKLDGDFSDDDLALVETMAASAAIAADNARLVQALRQRTVALEARNEELDAFAHTVAHDLKAPLAQVVGYAELLRERHITTPDEARHSWLGMIARNSRRMNSIIDELLLLSSVRKMEDVEASPLDMVSIIAEVQDRLTPMIEEYQAEITLPTAWPVALGYGPWIEEVWVNYLSNALKYGGRSVRVELGASPLLTSPMRGDRSEGEQVRFWIRDDGPGISPEDQARLFTLFTRLDQVRIKGHGLGLSIVRRIVERLGGQVGVESEVGAGSTFWFTLPIPEQ